jgi:hypothetical protein
MDKSKMTPGELLSRQLKGEDVTNDDIKKSSEKFFKERGLEVNVSINTIGNNNIKKK